MALLSTIKCHQCGKTKPVSYSANEGPPLICGDCEGENENKKREDYLSLLGAMSIEARLRSIEAELYDMKQNPPWENSWDRMIG